MALSYSIFAGNGSNRQFAVAFPYLANADVKVLVNGSPVDFTFLTSSVVQTVAAPPNGAVVKVMRTTPRSNLLTDFSDASTLTERDLDKFSLQLFYLAQETQDTAQQGVSFDDVNFLQDAHGYRIHNAGNPVNPQDVTTKSWVLSNTVSLDSVNGVFDAQSKRVINVLAPVNPNDAATKVWTETSMTSQVAIATAQAAQSTSEKNAAIVARTAAEAAAALAQSAVGTLAQVVYPNFATAQAATPVAVADAVILAGRVSAGDGGGGVFKKVVSEPTHLAKLQIGATWYEVADNIVNVKQFGAVADFNRGLGTGTNSYPAIQSALNYCAATGKMLYVPAGEYKTEQGLVYTSTAGPTLGYSLRMFGDGFGRSNITLAYVNGIVLSVTRGAGYQQGGFIKGMSLSEIGTTVSKGLSLHRVWSFTVLDCLIQGMKGDGIYIPVQYGDADPLNDGANHVLFEHVRVNSVSGYGLHCDMGVGVNELSYLTVRNCTFELCGTPGGGGIGGGMFWRGQCCLIENTAFLTCYSRGMYIDGGAGVGSNMTQINVTYENCESKAIECFGLEGGVFENIQIRNGLFPAQYGFYMDGAASSVKNISVRNAQFRMIDTNTPYIAFRGAGANFEAETCIVEMTNLDLWNPTFHTLNFGWTIKEHLKSSFMATMTAAQAVPSASDTKLAFNSVLWNDNGFYSTTLQNWKPPAGKGRISAAAYFATGVVNAAQYQVIVYKDNVAYKVLATNVASGTTGLAPGGSVNFTTDGTSVFDIRVYGGGAGAKDISNAASITYFCGEMF